MTQKEKQKKKNDVLKKESLIAEAYLTGIFWNKPELYKFYPEEKINRSTFQNPQWGFYFGLGRNMESKGVKIFDDISVAKHIKELGLESKYESYGEYDTIEEIMQEVRDKEPNLDAYYDHIKKYALLKSLVDLFGEEKVLKPNGKYNYKEMDKAQIHIYWLDQINRIGMDGDNKYDEHDLLDGLKESIKRWNENPAVGLPFYLSKMMTKITTGWDFGNLYLFGGFGGSGKTSMSFNKVAMSCIENQEKLLVLANEQSIEEFKKMLIITAMGVGTKEGFQRQRINEGAFTDDEIAKLEKAADWVAQLCEGDLSLIKFVFMEDYVMNDVKKIIRYYANRGYKSVMIDTGKPSEGGEAQKARWEVFADDFKELYKLCRPNGGGLNLRMWVNVQLADSALTRRFLNEHALGDSKKIKNEASVVFMIRPVWADEYEGGNHELECYRYVKNKHNPNKAYDKKEFKLKEGETYYLMFTPKNRRGMDNKTGLDILILKPNFNNNTWEEIGWTKVYDDRNY